MKVKDPHGTVWRVSRRWLPWRRRLRSYFPDLPVWAGGDDPISAIIGLILLILMIPFILLFIFVALEFLLLLLLLPFIVLVRMLFGRSWEVEAHRGTWPGELWWYEPSGTWSQSGRRLKNIAELIQRGQTPPHTAPSRKRSG